MVPVCRTTFFSPAGLFNWVKNKVLRYAGAGIELLTKKLLQNPLDKNICESDLLSAVNEKRNFGRTYFITNDLTTV